MWLQSAKPGIRTGLSSVRGLQVNGFYLSERNGAHVGLLFTSYATTLSSVFAVFRSTTNPHLLPFWCLPLEVMLGEVLHNGFEKD